MNNKLSYNEINEIRNWLQSRRINYLDIREELTDHFASKIEKLQAEESHSFSRAFLEARQGFYPNRFKINYLTNSFFKNFGLWFWELKKVFTSPIWLGMVLLGLGLIATFSFNFISIEKLQTNYFSSILYTLLLVLISESILTRAKTKNAGYITLLCSSYLFHYFFIYILWNIYGSQLKQPIELMIYFSVIYISTIAWLKLLIAKRIDAYQTSKLYLKTL
jgi:hypothetical protein